MATKQRTRRNAKKGTQNVSSSRATQVLRYEPGINRMPLPPIFETSFWCEGDYKVAIATASQISGAVKLNSIWLPFRPSGSTAFPSLTFQGPATESTLQPTGYSTMFGSTAPYNSYRVIMAEIFLRLSGSNSGNNQVVTVVPTVNTAPPPNVYVARTSPFAKEATFSVSKANIGTDRRGWLHHVISPYEIMGLTRKQADADIQENSSSAGSDPDLTLWWQIFFQSNDLDVTSTSASLLQIRCKYRVQCFLSDILPDTLEEGKDGIVVVKTPCACQHKRPP